VSGVAAGSVHIRYMVTNGFSCTDSAIKTIVVNAIPVVAAIGGASTVCVGVNTNLSSSPLGGTWTASNGTATITGAGVVTGMAAGTDTITYTFTNNCGSDSKTKVMTVNPQPVAGTISGADSVCVGATVILNHSGTTGAWNSNNTNASVTGSGVVSGVNAGKDTITYSVTNSCGTAKAIFPVTVLSQHYCDSVSVVYTLTENDPSVKVYPNPNKGVFVVDISSNIEEPVQIRVMNIVGQLVGEYASTTNKAFEIKMEQPAGVYFLTAFTLHSRYTTKVTISK